MKKLILPITILALAVLTSCGGSKDSEKEEKEMTLCDCLGLKDKYESKEDAEKAIGKDKIDKCMDLMKSASEDDIKNCE